MVFSTIIPSRGKDMPYQPEEAYDVGLFLPFNQKVFDAAIRTALPQPNLEEEFFFVADVVNTGGGENEQE